MPVKRRTPDGHALAELARRQHGVVAVLANEPGVASHRTAAWIHGLLRTRPGTFHFTASTRRHRRKPVVVHFARLAVEDVTRVEGIPVTSPAQTVLDLAPDESVHDLGRLLQRADDSDLLDRRRFEALLARTVGHAGNAKLAAALRTYEPELATLRSDLERRFRRLVLAAGLPRPQTNVVVEGYELDCYWEAEGFAVELDSPASPPTSNAAAAPPAARRSVA
jgi:hypothetical protein